MAITASAVQQVYTPPPAALSAQVQGRWEVLTYSEQGLQVDKKQPALSQAVQVYRNVQQERARTWFGYDYNYADDYNRRKQNEFQRWEDRDSTLEVRRVAEAIETPYYAIFFADSTLSSYNKDAAGRISYPEVRRYVFSPSTMSIDIYPQGYTPQPNATWNSRIEAQILFLSDTQMTLFLPEEAEIVTLAKTAYVMP
jgi:hypothetical protein